MRTTITLDEALVRQLQQACGARTKTAAVAGAVKEQLRRLKLRRLSALLGKIRLDESALRDAEQADRRRSALLERTSQRHGR
jgi:hypothetical protein